MSVSPVRELSQSIRRIRRSLRNLQVILGHPALIIGDHVYHIAAPTRRLIVLDTADPEAYIVRDCDLDPGGPTARVRAANLRPWN